MKGKELTIIGAITALGLLFRVIFMFALKSDWPGWDSPTIDALYHHLWAQQIASGDILGGGPYFRAPLYPLILGLIYSICGVNLSIVMLLQHLIGALAIPLVYVVAKKYFSRFVGYFAAALTAVNGVLIYFESQLLLDFLTVVFMMLFIYLLTLAQRHNKSKLYFIAGLIAGLFAITRPNILAVIPLVCLWIFLIESNFKTRLKRGLLLIAGALILVLPVTARNIIIGGDNVLIASQGGINFYIGNNERADGFTALLPGFGNTWQYSDAEFEAANNMGKEIGSIKPSEVSDYYYNKSYAYVFSKPIDFIKLIVKKLYLFWNYFEISNNNNLYFLTDYIGMSFIPMFLFAIISPLGLVGALLCFFKDRRYWIFPIIIFGYMFTVIAFFVTGRFRIPVVPLLSITAGFTLYEIYKGWIHRNYKRAIILFASILLAGLFAWTNFYNHHDRSMAMANYSLGNMFMKKGDYQSARAQYEIAINQGHCVPNAYLNLGVIAFYDGDTSSARSYFEEEILNCGPSGKAYNNLSMLARLSGDNRQAYAMADSSVVKFPNFKDAYINRILAAFAENDTILIYRAASDFKMKFPANPAARYYYGMYLMRTHKTEQAKVEFTLVVSSGSKDIVSEYDLSEIYSSSLPYGYNPAKIQGKSYYQLGLIAASDGDLNRALEHFIRAVNLLPDDPDARVNLALAYDGLQDYHKAEVEFNKAIALDSSQAVYYYNYALTLGKMGDYMKAQTMLEKAVQLKPDFSQAQRVLEALKQQTD